jgi:hypothetical protein
LNPSLVKYSLNKIFFSLSSIRSCKVRATVCECLGHYVYDEETKKKDVTPPLTQSTTVMQKVRRKRRSM